MRYLLVLTSVVSLLAACSRDDDTTGGSTVKILEIPEIIAQTAKSAAPTANEQASVLLDSATDIAKQFVQDSKTLDLPLQVNDEAVETNVLGEASAAALNIKMAEGEIGSMQMGAHATSNDSATADISEAQNNTVIAKEAEMSEQQITAVINDEGLTTKAMNELILQLDIALDSLEQSASEAKEAARALQQQELQ